LRAIAQTGLERLPALASVPTVSESGFPGFSAPSFWGFYAPSNTPARIVDRFVAELTAIIGEPEIRTKLTDSLLINLQLDGPPVFRKFFFEQVAKWREVIRENNLQHN
jgi:tripartite-type tricarboxylate transporter receptor subunit TctC